MRRGSRAGWPPLGGALSAAGRLPRREGAALLDAARAAFAHGLDYAALGAASVMILAAILTAVFFRGIRTGSPAAADQPAAALPEKLAA